VAFTAFSVVVWMSLGRIPDPDLPDPFEDLPHALAYAVLTTTLLVATHRNWSDRGTRWLLVAAAPIGVIVLGAALEWAQGFVGRDVEAGDILANAVGVSVAFVLWLTVRSVVVALRSRRAPR
jgi:VanZ family protein